MLREAAERHAARRRPPDKPAHRWWRRFIAALGKGIRLALAGLKEMAAVVTAGLVIVGAFFVADQYEDRREARIARAWSVIRAAQDAVGNVGQIAALEALLAAGANLRGANFSGMDLRGVALRGVDISYGIFVGTNLNGVDFTDATLQGAIFQDARLHSATFADAQLQHAQFARAKLTYADFTHADLSDAGFFRADLTNADFTSADLDYARLGEAILSRTNFSGSNISASALSSAKERYFVNVSSLDLRRARWLTEDHRTGDELCWDQPPLVSEELAPEWPPEKSCLGVSGPGTGRW